MHTSSEWGQNPPVDAAQAIRRRTSVRARHDTVQHTHHSAQACPSQRTDITITVQRAVQHGTTYRKSGLVAVVCSWPHLLPRLGVPAQLVHRPHEHGCAGLMARQQEGLDLVAQLRLNGCRPLCARALLAACQGVQAVCGSAYKCDACTAATARKHK